MPADWKLFLTELLGCRKMKSANKEKRRHSRVGECIPLEVYTGDGIHFASTTINISSGGVYFQVHRLIGATPGGKITVILPDGEKINCEIELIRTDSGATVSEYCWAGRFRKMSAGDLKKIARFINNACKKIGTVD